MQRYQVYLDPKSVSVVDLAANQLGTTRSSVLQQVVDILAIRFGLDSNKQDIKSRGSILEYAGILKYPKSEKNDYSTRPDYLYFGK